MVVFADGSGVVDAANNLHTNFSLSADGEVLALTRTDLTVASEWNPNGTPYPAQVSDVSYGNGTIYHNTTLVGTGASAKAFVPHDSSLDAGQWTAIGYNDSTWTAGATGVGYDTGGYEDNSIAPTLLADWNADDLVGTYANNTTVTSWKDNVAGDTATNSTGAPKLQTNSLNGHAVVRFTKANNDQLRVPAAKNPMAGAEDFTLAVVFRTTTAGSNAQGNWYDNTGIVDAEQSGSQNDWGIAYASTGHVAAGMGAPDTTIYSAGSSVVNNQAHVAIITRTDNVYTLYVDGGNGVSTTVSDAARNVSDMVFGSLQTSLHYFNGDIAEVKVYNGGATANFAYSITQTLATKYAATITAPTTQAASLKADWTADSLNTLANGATVTSWTSTVGTYTATGSAGTSPSLSKTQLSGHSVVHFTGSSSTELRASNNSGNNPMAGAGDFTVAVVFRTSTPGLNTSSQWYNNSGIVDAEQSGVTNDWGIGIGSGGQVGAGIGNPDATIYSGGGLADGNAHILVYTKSGTDTELYVDGAAAIDGAAAAAARNLADMVFGREPGKCQLFHG